MYRMRPGTGDEFALIMLPVVLLLMLLFNAAKTGKFGLRLAEKIHRLSARTQALGADRKGRLLRSPGKDGYQ